MTKKNRRPLISLTFSAKIFLSAFLILVLCGFSGKDALEIVLINLKKAESGDPAWKERRLLAEIIQNIALDNPKAIVVTIPCTGYTSVGADRLLINTVKNAGSVYFILPSWDALYGYAKGIAHADLIEEKKLIFVKEKVSVGNKDYPALCALLAKELFNRDLKSDFSFDVGAIPKFKQYSAGDVFNLKGKDEFKDKVCFVGNRKANILQAGALYGIISGQASVENESRYLYYFIALLFVVCCVFIAYALLRHIRKKHLIRLPQKAGRLCFGKSYYLTKFRLSGIFDFMTWPDGRIWLWMGDFDSPDSPFDLKNFFHTFKEPLGSREVMIRLNKELYDDGNHAFTNLIFMDIRPQEGRIIFSNAGFEVPLFFVNSNKEFHQLHEPGEPLGVRRDLDFDEQEIILDRSDILFLFNSGAVKSRNRDGRFIDLEQLKYVITQNSQLPASLLAEKTLRLILSFNAGKPSEDMLFLTIKAD
ncbi:MAG: PP2C family protein-serine/threonine phosphatase [Candidatus Omnitrophica bacterium]|nr:PP2C family protein-serine/threonine phosphatase [Candidatus Omnitrophota bacterium]MDD5610531.1 PP2C family protein-serine/threonine phosphatase [Candidatus Omnitrophota bacterium]